MSMEKNVEKAGSLIPEIYYDVIARIIPGCITLFGMVFIARSSGHLGWLPGINECLTISFSAGSFAVFSTLSLGYITGILLTPWGKPMIGRIHHLLCCLQRDKKNDPIPDNARKMIRVLEEKGGTQNEIDALIRLENVSSELDYQLDHLLYEEVRMSSQNASIVAKMRAEMGSCRNLTVAVFSLLIFTGVAAAISTPDRTPHLRVVAMGLAVLFILTVKAAFYRETAYYTRLLSFYYLAHRSSSMKVDMNL